MTALAGLGLVGDALEVASEMQAKWPVIFTSGRRNVIDQARAMALDVVASGKGAAWIIATYAPSAARSACVDAVCDLTTPLNTDNVTTAIGHALAPLSNAELAHLSRHLGGCAFDLSPSCLHEPWWSDAEAYLRGECRDRGGKLLLQEGGLTRVHAEFPVPAVA
jgi:hypothetical protein